MNLIDPLGLFWNPRDGWSDDEAKAKTSHEHARDMERAAENAPNQAEAKREAEPQQQQAAEPQQGRKVEQPANSKRGEMKGNSSALADGDEAHDAKPAESSARKGKTFLDDVRGLKKAEAVAQSGEEKKHAQEAQAASRKPSAKEGGEGKAYTPPNYTREELLERFGRIPGGIMEALEKGGAASVQAFGELGKAFATNDDFRNWTLGALFAGAVPIATAASAPGAIAAGSGLLNPATAQRVGDFAMGLVDPTPSMPRSLDNLAGMAVKETIKEFKDK